MKQQLIDEILKYVGENNVLTHDEAKMVCHEIEKDNIEINKLRLRVAELERAIIRIGDAVENEVGERSLTEAINEAKRSAKNEKA